jgi:hypothetical protein
MEELMKSIQKILKTSNCRNANNVVEEDLHQPPVKKVTWFHTGAFDRNENILKQFAAEYKKGPFEFDLIDPLLEGDIYPTEYREAFRACKSKILREEVYAMDGSLSEDKPFTVSMHNCFIRLLQPKQKNKFAAFLVAESEAANYYYERNENDPRIAHTFNIAIDKFGNVTESASLFMGEK